LATQYDEQRLDMEYQNENTTGDDAASDEDKMFFRYLRDAYQCFLCGDDERYEELDEELVRVYRDRQEDIRAQTAQVLESHAELTAQVDELTNRNSVLPELEANKRDYAEDLVKFRQLIERLVEHKDALESKGREYAQEVSERKAELDVAERARDRVKARLELQEVSPADAERMHMEKRRLEEAIAQVLKDRESAQQSKWELEMELSRKVEDLEACIKTYNAAATRLKLVPLNAAANAQGVEFELRLDMASYFRGSSVLSGDSIKDAIRPALRELQEIAIRKTHEARARSMEVKAQVDRNEEERTEYTERIAQLNAKLSKSADQYSHEKEVSEQRAR
jgi:kinetochore protein NDC80